MTLFCFASMYPIRDARPRPSFHGVGSANQHGATRIGDIPAVTRARVTAIAFQRFELAPNDPILRPLPTTRRQATAFMRP